MDKAKGSSDSGPAIQKSVSDLEFANTESRPESLNQSQSQPITETTESIIVSRDDRNEPGFSESATAIYHDFKEAVAEYFKPFFKTIEVNALNVVNSFNYTDKSSWIGRITNFYLIPDGPFLYFWIRITIASAYINGLLLSYTAAFREDNSVFFTLSYIIDVIFLLDMYFKFHIAFLSGGYWIIHPKEMALNNMQHLRFKVDVVANFPTDFFIVFFLGEPRDTRLLILALLRLNRWIRTLRMISWFNVQGKHLHSSYELLLAKFFCYLSTLLHTIACVWYALACPSSRICKASSWVSVNGIARNETSTASMYMQSLYWAVTTVTTTGYGDIRPDNNYERSFAALCMLLGTFFFAYASGIITSVIANLDGRRINLQQKVDSMLTYMRDRNVNTNYQRKVVEWYEYQWERNRGIDIQTVFADLPSSFRSDMVLNMNVHIVSRSYFLKTCSASFKRAVAVAMKFTLYTANQYVVHKGDPGLEMYFIVRGRIDTYDEDALFPIRSYTEGAHYGEVQLIVNKRHPHNARATVNTDIYILCKSDLEELFAIFPSDRDLVTQLVTQSER